MDFGGGDHGGRFGVADAEVQLRYRRQEGGFAVIGAAATRGTEM